MKVRDLIDELNLLPDDLEVEINSRIWSESVKIETIYCNTESKKVEIILDFCGT